MTVRPFIRVSSASITSFSDSLSSAAVGSSNRSTGDSASVAGTHFWSGCALFARASAEERAETRLEWFERAEGEFRAAVAAGPEDWDAKFNYELTRALLNRLREQPDTPRRLLFELIRPQSPRSGGTAPARRTG